MRLRLFTLILMLTGCAQPPDLMTPCPDYGKHCLQTAINTDSLA
ncbi:T4SS-associated protein LvhB7 [Legionella micdadei]|nr:T4SS-associated protein LvhB7 [Legionella micdadei]